MSVTIGRTTLDRVVYEADADVLSLHAGDSAGAVEFDESPEGHALRFDGDGRLVGVTIVDARWLLDREGAIRITGPERLEVARDALRGALTAA